MFQARTHTNVASATLRFSEVVYHCVVQSIRKTDGNAVMALLKSISQTILMVVMFYIMLSLLGGRSMAVRGDYFLYLLSGIFVFMTHIKAVKAVSGSDGPNSPMMQHTPMNSLVAIVSGSLAVLYTQILCLFTVLLVYHTAINSITIYSPVDAFGMVLLAWLSGIGVGYVFLALRPWMPGVVAIGTNVYTRVNMFASGKMFVANSLPFSMLPVFSWNPLFHIIDQTRGYTFINYVPRITSWEYAFWLSLALIMIGFIGEGFVRQRVSVNWVAKA